MHIGTFQGSSDCSKVTSDQDKLICSSCICKTYSDVYDASVGCTPCVFNVRTDPSERDNLVGPSGSPAGAELLKNLTHRLKVLRNTSYSPVYPASDLNKACEAMAEEGGGFFVPWEDN